MGSPSCPTQQRPTGADHRLEVFQELVAAVFESAYLIALTIAGDPTRAEAALEEATLKAWWAYDGYDPRTPFKPWFLRVLARECLSHGWAVEPGETIAGSQPESDRPLVREAAAAGGPAPLTITAGFGSDDVLSAVRTLPVPFRAATALKLVENLSYAQIGLTLDIPTSEARSHIHHARMMLLSRLGATAAGKGLPARSV